MNRYTRQMILPSVGAEGQARLRNSCALVVGAGALGAPVLQYLAGAGVGHIVLMDPDQVELCNLHRQPLHDESRLGMKKVDSAVERLRALNSSIQLTTHAVALTPDNAPDFVQQADVAIDCADSFAVSYTLSDECLRQRTPYISASVLGLAGYVGGFCHSAPSLRAVFPTLPAQATTCSEAGVMGPVAGALGCVQAQMALAVLLGQTPSPLGLMVSMNFATFSFERFRFDHAPEPEQIDYRFVGLNGILATDRVIDLRAAHEAGTASPTGAQRVGVDELSTWLQSHPANAPEQRLILACRSGVRAWRAAESVRAHWAGEMGLLALGNAEGNVEGDADER